MHPFRAQARRASTGFWNRRVSRPTSTAAATVPSRTPSTRPRNTRPMATDRQTRVTSKATFMLPNRTGSTWQTASTTPSPAVVTSPAATSTLTPSATSRMPAAHSSHWRALPPAGSGASTSVPRSIMEPKSTAAGICSSWNHW
ncbi:MAG TPA: hypothetical protein H9773_09585 [Candidatus Fournierella merdavium]|nr:hypothetical protein [Candidatus Fournierella merdavium]